MARQPHLGTGMAVAAGAALGVGIVAGAGRLLANVVGRAAGGRSRRVFAPQPCGLPAFAVSDQSVRSRMEGHALEMGERVSNWLGASDVEQVVLAVDGGDLRLSGSIVYAPRASRNWAVLAHEYRGSSRSMEKFGEMYARKGFNVLLVDLRGHGRSEGDFITMGWNDGQDILEWVGYLASRFGADIRVVLHGQSMGAASVMHAAAESCPQVVAVVVDSCGARMKDALLRGLGRVSAPSAPALYAVLRATVLLRCGYDLSKDNPVEFARTCTAPTLIIHGAADSLVAPAQSADIYSACAAEAKKLVIVPEADHLGCAFVDPQRYEDELFDFLTRVGVVGAALDETAGEE